MNTSGSLWTQTYFEFLYSHILLMRVSDMWIPPEALFRLSDTSSLMRILSDASSHLRLSEGSSWIRKRGKLEVSEGVQSAGRRHVTLVDVK